MQNIYDMVVLIKGAGEVATGIAYRLHVSQIRVCCTEIATPMAVTRGTTYSEAVYDGSKEIMGVKAKLVAPQNEAIHQTWQQGDIPVIIDPEASIKDMIKPDVLVDAIMAKRNTGTKITDAPLVIGIGPGFYAGRDVHLVVESNHDANLGKVILEGEAEKNTSIPIAIDKLTSERIIWATEEGTFTSTREIGDEVKTGEVIGYLDALPLKAPLNGVLRGLIRTGVKVTRGKKLIEVYPVHDADTGNVITKLIAKKVMTIGEGVFRATQLYSSEKGEFGHAGNL